MILGRDALTRSDSHAIVTLTKAIANEFKFVNTETGWNGFNILHRSQGQVNALELGLKLTPCVKPPKVIFLLGCDSNIQPSDIPKKAFVVYIGSSGDQGAQFADAILPASAFTEQSATYGMICLMQSIQKGGYKWPMLWSGLLGIHVINGKSYEHCPSNVVWHCPTTH